MVTRSDVVVCARSWVRTPYQHQQRMKYVGVDCAGLVIGVARELCLVAADFDVNGYARRPDGVSMLAECDKFMSRIETRVAVPGDVLVMRFVTDPQHMAIVGDYLHGGLTMIHAHGTSDGKGRVTERRLDPSMLATVIQAYALPGVV